MDVEIQSSVLRCLREWAPVDEVVKLLDTGEGTIRRIFALTKHFDDLFFSLSRSTSCWVTNLSNSFCFLANSDSCFNSTKVRVAFGLS